MDEPFGALDALTRDQLNVDLQRLCRDMKVTVVFVTHSISEAAFLSDRVVVFSPRPGRVEAILPINLNRPRSLAMRGTEEFNVYTRAVTEVFERAGVLKEL